MEKDLQKFYPQLKLSPVVSVKNCQIHMINFTHIQCVRPFNKLDKLLDQVQPIISTAVFSSNLASVHLPHILTLFHGLCDNRVFINNQDKPNQNTVCYFLCGLTPP